MRFLQTNWKATSSLSEERSPCAFKLTRITINKYPRRQKSVVSINKRKMQKYYLEVGWSLVDGFSLFLAALKFGTGLHFCRRSVVFTLSSELVECAPFWPGIVSSLSILSCRLSCAFSCKTSRVFTYIFSCMLSSPSLSSSISVYTDLSDTDTRFGVFRGLLDTIDNCFCRSQTWKSNAWFLLRSDCNHWR